MLEKDFHAQSLPDDLGRVHVVRALVGRLQECVDEAVEAVRGACQPFTFINSGLAITHLHGRSELRGYVGGDSPIGFYWLLEPPLVRHWSGMWGIELWVERWRRANRAKGMASASTYLSVVRSRVLQQVDLRLREALIAIDQLVVSMHSSSPIRAYARHKTVLAFAHGTRTAPAIDNRTVCFKLWID